MVFSIQEAIISAIYIYQTVCLLWQRDKHGDRHNQRLLRKLLAHLIFVNVMVVVLDITLLAVQFSGHYEIQTTYKTAVYSVKLKVEFSILNRLARFLTNRGSTSGNFHLDTFTSSKKTRPSTVSDGHGSFVKMDDIGQIDNNEAQSPKMRLKVIKEEANTIRDMDKRAAISV